MFSFSKEVKEVNHKTNGLLNLSIDQLSSSKREAFSILKRDNKGIVACKFTGESLLCSNKNVCFLVISKKKQLYTTVSCK